MKKVLFYFGNICNETSRGGTEVATYRIAKALKDTGECEVYHAYHATKGTLPDTIYTDTVVLPKTKSPLAKTLSEFIRKHEIDNVVVMGRFFKFGKIKKGIEESGLNPKIIFMQHFAPGSEKKKTTFSASFHLLKLNPYRLRYLFRTLFYPLVKLPRTIRWKKVYREVYEGSSNVVLLSEGYFKDYCKVAGIRDDSKFIAIPNIYELPKVVEKKTLVKQKRILILSRMDEIQKRISLALKIWARIEDDPDLNDWHLDIVGSGNNNDIVKRQIKKLGLQNVTFHGWQDREEFLKRSAILMMTSEYEGLPLSLLEAQAYGCVPIAFNSYASLKDIITPHENGVVVEKFGDTEEYVKQLKDLMYNPDYREELSAHTSNTSKNFTSEKIADRWLKILT